MLYIFIYIYIWVRKNKKNKTEYFKVKSVHQQKQHWMFTYIYNSIIINLNKYVYNNIIKNVSNISKQFFIESNVSQKYKTAAMWF